MSWNPKPLSKDARRGLEDLFFFLTEFWGLDLEHQPHKEMCQTIENSEFNEDTPYSMLCVPRGSYKTSIGRGAVVWKQLRQIYLHKNYYHRIVIASATLALGETSLRAIEGRLRHKDFIAAFGRMFINDRKDNLSSRHPDGLVLAPRVLEGEIASVAEPSFWVGSERRISTGFHADSAFVDDLNNLTNVSTDHQRLKVQSYWELLFPILQRKDRNDKPTTILMTCTPWMDDDVGGRIRRSEKDRAEQDASYKSRWNILHKSAYEDDGSAWFPTVLSLDALEELRETLSPTLFSANYLCDPVGKTGFVDEDQILFKPRKEFPTLRWMRATVDPSQHNDAKVLGCYTAELIGGYDNFANLYILDARGSRDWDTSDLIESLFQIHADYPDIPLLIEDAHMSHLRHALKLEEESRSSKSGQRVSLRVQWIPVGSESKYAKWLKMQPRFRNRRVFFAEEIEPKLKAEIKEELVRGTAARFKDFLDALAMMENGVSPRIARDGKAMDQSRQLGNAIPLDPRARTWGSLLPGVTEDYG